MEEKVSEQGGEGFCVGRRSFLSKKEKVSELGEKGFWKGSQEKDSKEIGEGL